MIIVEKLMATVEKLLSIILKIYAAALTPSWNEPDIQCVEGVPLWRESASIINHEFLKGYRQRGGEINEFIAGYISLCYIFFLFEVWRNKMTQRNHSYTNGIGILYDRLHFCRLWLLGHNTVWPRCKCLVQLYLQR